MGDKQRWHTLPGKEGVLYREHPTRKHGRGPDRCLSIRYRVGEGKRVHESLGWTSEGWTVAKAVALLRELKENIRTGKRPRDFAADSAAEKDVHIAFFEESGKRAVSAVSRRDDLHSADESVLNLEDCKGRGVPEMLEDFFVFTCCRDDHFGAFFLAYQNLDELKAHYQRGGLGDGTVKKFLNEILQNELRPIREKRELLAQDLGEIFRMLEAGSRTAEAVAAKTLSEVKTAMGINYFNGNELPR